MLTQDMDYIPINHKPDQKNPYTYHFTDVNTTHHLIERINAGKDLHFLSRTNLLTKLPGREHVLGQLGCDLMIGKVFSRSPDRTQS